VTGGASGIGRALTEELASRGCSVVAADVDFETPRETAAIPRDGLAGAAVPLDVRDAAAFRQLVEDTRRTHGRLDYLFNNAGIGAGGEFLDLTADDWRRVVDVNLFGVIHGVFAAYPVMREQGFGHIVNTASMQGLLPSPVTSCYATTKHAIVGLSKSLRAEAADSGVRVSVLCPGVIRTPLLEGGKHGVFPRTLPLERQRETMRAFFERFRPMEASTFARSVLDQVARNRPIIIVPSWWRVLWWLDRASPSLSIWLARAFVARSTREMITPRS
jgi:NAD(P)-dependent dehydrogenase (short-subunit alcohol dehydrogenase family)